jgi:DNA mismatch repair ATPase MutS
MNKKEETMEIHKQFKKIKDKFPNKILLIRIGEYYEVFFEDTDIFSRVSGIPIYTLDYGKICGFKSDLITWAEKILNEKGVEYKVIENYREFLN